MLLFEIVFVLSALVVLYVYAGYPALLLLFTRLGIRVPRPSVRGDSSLPYSMGRDGAPTAGDPALPTVTLLIAAYNEEDVIESKLENCSRLDYPRELLEIAVVADGSSDRTCELVARHPGVRLFFESARRGKVGAIKRVMSLLASDIVVISDANAMYHPMAVRRLAEHFQDGRVGSVFGSKRIVSDPQNPGGGGEGLYWRYESRIMQMESTLHSAMGAAGEIVAIRRAYWEPPPKDAIIEDFHIVMQMVYRGYRNLYEPAAISLEAGSAEAADDLERRTRIAAGGWQSIIRLRGLLNPFRYGWVSFALFSHRALRWMVVPWLMVLLLPLSNIVLVLSGACCSWILLLLLQGLAWAAALLGHVNPSLRSSSRLLLVFHFLYLTNIAAVLGSLRYLRGRQSVTWKRVKRQSMG